MRQSLRQKLDSQTREELANRFNITEAAPEFTPVPAGTYVANLVEGNLCVVNKDATGKGTPGYTCQFEIAEGEHTGRRIWHTLWLTDAATPYAKRDLLRLGITSFEQLEQPVPLGVWVKLRVTVRTDDDGRARNHAASIAAGGINPDPFMDPDFGFPEAGSSREGGVA